MAESARDDTPRIPTDILIPDAEKFCKRHKRASHEAAEIPREITADSAGSLRSEFLSFDKSCLTEKSGCFLRRNRCQDVKKFDFVCTFLRRTVSL